MFATSPLDTVGKAAKHQIDAGVKNKRQDSEFRGIFWRLYTKNEILPNTMHDGCDPRLVSVAQQLLFYCSTHDKRMRGALRINYIHHQEVESQVSKGGDLTNVFIVVFSSNSTSEREWKSIDAKVACLNEKI